MPTSKLAKKPELDVFGSHPENAILFPNPPMNVRCNCQQGQWIVGENRYGDKLSMLVVKFSLWFGDLGQTKKSLWGQVWFLPVAGELPSNICYVTYVKTASLRELLNRINVLKATGNNPAKGVWTPHFQKHSGNAEGNPTTYYSLSWDWMQMDQGTLDNYQTAIVPQVYSNLPTLFDIDGTRAMTCFDNLTAQERAQHIQDALAA